MDTLRWGFFLRVMLLALAIGGAVTLPGCESRPPLEELGELEFDVPDLPGIDEPYRFPWGTERSKRSAEDIEDEGLR